jgi:hypothetical protein
MKKRILRIMIFFVVWLIPIAGIYFGIQIHNGLGFILTIISCGLFVPTTGWLFDAITNDRVLCLNVYYPWKSRLKKIK